jgi:hypothetical protein
LILSSNDFKKVIRSAGIGGWLGRGIRLFDTEYYAPEFEYGKRLFGKGVAIVSAKGLIPSSEYRKNRADCDNFSMWYQSEVTQLWALDKSIGGDQAITIGRSLVPGHDINIGYFSDAGWVVWNYGVITEWNLKEISEVEFK